MMSWASRAAIVAFLRNEDGFLRAIGRDASNTTLGIDTLTDRDVSDGGALLAPTVVFFNARPTDFEVDEITLPAPDYATTPTSGTAEVYDPAFHEIQYYWTVTRPGGAASTFRSGLNMLTSWNSRNIAYGKHVAFCFDEPGDYTVTCFAVGPTGLNATTSVTFNDTDGDYPAARDPEAYYTGSNNVCVNPAGDTDFTWAPSGSDNYSTGADDLAVIDAAAPAFAGDVNKRLLFKPGASYDLSGRTTSENILNIGASENKTRVYIGRNTGDKPIIECGEAGHFLRCGQTGDSIESFTITNLDFRSGWDPRFEVGLNGGRPIRTAQAAHYNVHNIDIKGWAIGLATATSGESGVTRDDPAERVIWPYRFGYSEVHVSDWTTFGFYAQLADGDIALIGSKITQNVDAINVNSTDRPYVNDSGPTRFNWSNRIYFGGCDIFANNGINSQQNPLRLNNGYNLSTSTRAGWAYYNLDRIVTEGGSNPIGITPQEPDFIIGGRQPCNYVCDKMLVVGSEWTSFVMGGTPGICGGGTLRDIMFVIPDTAKEGGSSTTFFDFGTDAEADDNRINFANGVRIFSSTFVMARSVSNNGGGSSMVALAGNFADFDDRFVQQNNLYHAPNMSTMLLSNGGASVAFGGTMTGSTAAGFTPRYKGRNDPWGLITLSTLAGVSGTIADGGTFKILFSEIPTTTIEGRAATGTVNQTYYTNNPTHTFHYVNNADDVIGLVGDGLSAVVDATGITFTNNTGGDILSSYTLHIDRRGLHPGVDTSSGTPSGTHVIYTPDSAPADPGLISMYDMFLATRADPKSAGAIEV